MEENNNFKESDWDPRDYQGRSWQKVKNNEDISFWTLLGGSILVIIALLFS